MKVRSGAGHTQKTRHTKNQTHALFVVVDCNIHSHVAPQKPAIDKPQAIRVFLADDAYKTIIVNSETTVSEVIKQLKKKERLPKTTPWLVRARVCFIRIALTRVGRCMSVIR